MEIDVYAQYFGGECVYNGVERNGVLVKLTAESGGGMIRYHVNLTFFPHRSPEDFAVSYDAYASKEIFNKKGRRSKKREAEFLENLREHADALAAGLGGVIFWEKPLRDAMYG